MVIANDTPYSGFHTDPQRLKHTATTKLALTELFYGEAGNVHHFTSEFAQQMKSVGLKSEFNIKNGERPCPLKIAETTWQTEPTNFIFQNLLDNYSGNSR
jgi:hypothetical protein